MKLYIKVENGVPQGHPATEENLRIAFPDIDLNDPSCGFVEFKRVPPPPTNPYHAINDMIYVDVGGTYTEIYPIRNMTPPERTEKQEHTKQRWANESPHQSWVFDEVLCAFKPPIPMPDDRTRLWRWNEETISWDDVTPSHSPAEEDAFKKNP